MTNEEFNEMFRKKTKAFAVRTIQFIEKLPKTRVTNTIVFQLGKSATSVGANYRAFCRGRSLKELFSKMCIVVEEADESLFWLEIIEEVGYDNSSELKYLLSEGNEILKVVAKTKNSLQDKLKDEKRNGRT